MIEESYRRDIEETDEELESVEGDPINFWEKKQHELVTSTVDYNLRTIFDLIQTKVIDLSPEYQRRPVKLARQSRHAEVRHIGPGRSIRPAARHPFPDDLSRRPIDLLRR